MDAPLLQPAIDTRRKDVAHGFVGDFIHGVRQERFHKQIAGTFRIDAAAQKIAQMVRIDLAGRSTMGALQAVASPVVSLARVGREGVIGLMPPADGASKPCQAVAETAGEGCRIALSQVQAAMETSSEVMLVLLRYQHALTAQITQAALCRHHHTLEQQFCRWLLLGVDWLDGAERVVSCHVESEFVGHRMEEVIAVVHRLQAASLIECAWPQITVRDREGLAQRCCDCYATIKREYQIL